MESSLQRPIDRDSLLRVLDRYRAGDAMAAAAYLRGDLKLAPEAPESRCYLAALALEIGDLAAAGQLLDELAAKEPPRPEIFYLRGRLAEARGHHNEACTHLTRALDLRPDYVGALYALGRVTQRCALPAQAVVHYREALRLYPKFADAAYNLGKVLSALGRLDEALAAFKQALDADPAMVMAHSAMASTLRDLGEPDQARACMQEASVLSDDPLLKIRRCLMVPVVCPSAAGIDETRRQIEGQLDLILAERPHCPDPYTTLGSTGFYLAYHGRDNRALQSKLAAAYRAVAPDLVWTAPEAVKRRHPGGRIRLGIVSRHLRRHTIGYLNAGIVANLSRSGFEVMVGHFQDQSDDPVTQAIDRAADRVVRLAPRITEARRQLAALNLDLLYYPDIGMNPVTYFLAFSRLAPVQCTSWGHPDTTGIPTLDYYLSNRLAEPVGAQAHYTEKLVCLSRFPMVLPAPVPAPERRRQDFGLPVKRRVYLCPQSLFKLHPDFDGLVQEILRQDREAVVVLFEGKHPRWRQLLLRRMALRMPDLVGRVLFLPRVPEKDFPSVLRLADAVIDPPHFTGGFTSLIAFGQGVPVVTLPGAFMRGRLTYALYRQMGLAEAVAVDASAAVALALKLANDRAFHQRLSDQIRQSAAVLFDDLTAVRELERFFVQAVDVGARVDSVGQESVERPYLVSKLAR